MNKGDYRWDSPTELRIRCKLTMKLHEGHRIFTAGKQAFATATLMPDGETLDVTVWPERVREKQREHGQKNVLAVHRDVPDPTLDHQLGSDRTQGKTFR